MKSYLWPILLASTLLVWNPVQSHTNFKRSIERITTNDAKEECSPVTVRTPFQEKFDTWLQICIKINNLLVPNIQLNSVRTNLGELQIKSTENFLKCFHSTIMTTEAPIDMIPVLWWRVSPVFNEIKWKEIAKEVAEYCSQITQ